MDITFTLVFAMVVVLAALAWRSWAVRKWTRVLDRWIPYPVVKRTPSASERFKALEARLQYLARWAERLHGRLVDSGVPYSRFLAGEEKTLSGYLYAHSGGNATEQQEKDIVNISQAVYEAANSLPQDATWLDENLRLWAQELEQWRNTVAWLAPRLFKEMNLTPQIA